MASDSKNTCLIILPKSEQENGSMGVNYPKLRTRRTSTEADARQFGWLKGRARASFVKFPPATLFPQTSRFCNFVPPPLPKATTQLPRGVLRSIDCRTQIIFPTPAARSHPRFSDSSYCLFSLYRMGRKFDHNIRRHFVDVEKGDAVYNRARCNYCHKDIAATASTLQRHLNSCRPYKESAGAVRPRTGTYWCQRAN